MEELNKPAKSKAPALDKARVLEVAVQLIAEKGLAAFSLRDLARALDVYPAAVHWHVKSKNALLGEICSHVMATTRQPEKGLPWEVALEQVFRNYRDVLMQNPYLSQLLGAQIVSNSNRNLHLIESILEILHDAKCPEDRIVASYNAIVAAIWGYSTLEFSPLPSEDLEGWQDEVKTHLHQIPVLGYPRLAAQLGKMVNNAFVLRWQSGAQNPLQSGFDCYVRSFIAGLKLQFEAVSVPTAGS